MNKNFIVSVHFSAGRISSGMPFRPRGTASTPDQTWNRGGVVSSYSTFRFDSSARTRSHPEAWPGTRPCESNWEGTVEIFSVHSERREI